MKLTELSPNQPDTSFFDEERTLSEGAPRNVSSASDIPVGKPIGISDEEYTEEYISHLHDLKARRPDLFKKIMNGL